jgi:hypothetical protein
MAGGDQNMKWDCKLPHEKWKELDVNQLKSAIRNIGDPHTEMKKEMIAEARRRWFVSTDPSLLDGPRSPWLDFFDKLNPRSIDEKFQELLKELK